MHAAACLQIGVANATEHLQAGGNNLVLLPGVGEQTPETRKRVPAVFSANSFRQHIVQNAAWPFG